MLPVLYIQKITLDYVLVIFLFLSSITLEGKVECSCLHIIKCKFCLHTAINLVLTCFFLIGSYMGEVFVELQ